MLHGICTQKNRINSLLLVVGSQIANLTLGLSFGHNLCFKCSNEQCKPILDIYASRDFQWYKELFKPLSFDPCNRLLKIRESTGTPTPKVELPWGVKVHSLTPSHTLGSMLCDSRLPSWPATLQTLALVASPRLGLWQFLTLNGFWKCDFNKSYSYICDRGHECIIYIIKSIFNQN
jgi:hypothetical protein